MKLSFARGWFSEEDSTGEFAAYAKKNPKSRVVFWEDVYTTKPGSLQRVGPPRRTAASLLTWLQRNPNLTVSKPTSGRIGTIRARVVDIGVAHDAVNDDPTCPAKPCANFLGYPGGTSHTGLPGNGSAVSTWPMFVTAGNSICSWPLSKWPVQPNSGRSSRTPRRSSRLFASQPFPPDRRSGYELVLGSSSARGSSAGHDVSPLTGKPISSRSHAGRRADRVIGGFAQLRELKARRSGQACRSTWSSR